MLHTKLSTKGQVIIPSIIRDQMKLTAGTRFEVEMEDDRIVLRPVTEVDPIEYLYGLFKDGSDMLAELEADHAAEIEKEK